MAFTANQLLSYNDLVTLVNEEEYFIKNSFTPSNELVTKLQIMDALWLDGNPPLVNYTTNQLVRYADIAPLGTAWVGADGICVDDSTPVVVLPPTIYAGSITSSSIEVEWGASPGSSPNGIWFYVIEIYQEFFLWGDPRTISDILLTPRKYTYTDLNSDTAYAFRVKAIDSTGIESAWSNILPLSTAEIPTDSLTLTVVKQSDSAGRLDVYLDGIVGDYVTLRLSIASAGSIGYEERWFYSSNQNGEMINGEDDPTIPTTIDTVVYMTNSTTEAVWGRAFRSGAQVGFEGWTVADIKIINSSLGTPYNGTAKDCSITPL